MSSLFTWTRDEALKALADFDKMPDQVVLRARMPKDIQSEINEALARLGLCVVVLPAVAKEAYDSHQVTFFPKVELRLRLVENTMFNKTRIDIYELSEICFECLHGWMPEGANWDEPMRMAVSPVHLLEFPGERVMDLVFLFASHLVTPAN